MKVSAIKLRDALSIISLVPSRSGILPSEFLRIRVASGALRLALAAEIFGEVAVAPLEASNEDWTFFAERKLVTAFVGQCTDATDADEITLEHAATADAPAGELTVKYKRRKAVLHGVNEITGYGKHSTKDMAPITLSDEHKELIRIASKYAPLDPTTADLNCVYLLDKTAIQASNQVVIFNAASKSIPTTLPFPLMLPELLANKDLKSILVGASGSRLNFGCGYLYQLVSEKCRTDFPSKRILGYIADGAKLPKLMIFEPAALLAILQRLQAYTSGAGVTDVSVRCKGDQGKRTMVLTSDAAQGWFSEHLTLEKPAPSVVDCEWPLSHLLPFIEFVSKEKSMYLACTDNSPYYFHAASSGAIIDLIIARKSAPVKK